MDGPDWTLIVLRTAGRATFAEMEARDESILGAIRAEAIVGKETLNYTVTTSDSRREYDTCGDGLSVNEVQYQQRKRDK